ncbi:MAG: hypothetical protein HDKAJFGB_00651 [Anaerolineae bacterium]|nr:hypothetical protein [Anaerolineae bacterium]
MRRWLGGFIFGLILLCVTLAGQPAFADNDAQCAADPVSGPPGTKFDITCTGFMPNTHVNAYVVEPDGRAISGIQVVGFTSNIGNGSILTDAQGAAHFVWQSEDGTHELTGGGSFAHQLGNWTWVVHQLGAAQSIVVNAQVQVTIESANWEQVGATLNATSSHWSAFHFSGNGFWRDEYVNLWVTLPPNCSGRGNVEGASADDPYYQGLFDGFFGPNTVKANERGEISFDLVFTAHACRGEYHATAYAPGSGYGAITAFQVSGDVVTNSSNRRIIAAPTNVDALNPILTILGGAWDANQTVSCWSTRPDGRTFDLGTVISDAGGNFALDTHLSGFDSLTPYASEEPGVWSITCRPTNGGGAALTNVTVHALTSDP